MSNALDDLEPENAPAAQAKPTPELGELQGLLSGAYSIIHVMLRHLRESQGVLQHAAVKKIHDTSAKLTEVTSATETAATDIMDGLDRAMLLVDRLDDGAPTAEVIGELRDELFGMMNHMQFQDITSQQLRFAASLLQEMEHQLTEFAHLFDQQGFAELRPKDQGRVTYDPSATIHSSEQRQALVDELLTTKR